MNAKSSLGDTKSSLGDANSSLYDAESSLGDAESSLGDAKSSLYDAESSLGDAKSSPGDGTSSLGDAKSLLGDVQMLDKEEFAKFACQFLSGGGDRMFKVIHPHPCQPRNAEDADGGCTATGARESVDLVGSHARWKSRCVHRMILSGAARRVRHSAWVSP